jgi:hypothetical protein
MKPTFLPIDIRVDCYSGYRGDETPRMLWLGTRRVVVAEIIDRWLAPDHRYFKFRGDDRCLYIIRRDVVTFTWQMIFFQDPNMENVFDQGPPSGNA